MYELTPEELLEAEKEFGKAMEAYLLEMLPILHKYEMLKAKGKTKSKETDDQKDGKP
jgi:hypothetical protein